MANYSAAKMVDLLESLWVVPMVDL